MKHSFERLLWLWDIALMARRVEAEGRWDELLRCIRQYRIERPCYYALSYARAHLATPVPGAWLATIRPPMGRRERHLFERFMRHEAVPFLAERVFAHMMPGVIARVLFWYETVVPRREVRQQVAGADDAGTWRFVIRRLGQAVRFLAGSRGG